MAGALAAFAGAVVAVAGFRVVLAGPAEGAELFGRETDGVNQVVDTLERKGREVQLLADVFHHALVGIAIGVGVFFQARMFAFLVADVAAGNQVVFVLAAGEVDELAGEHERRAGDTHVGFFTAQGVELLGLLAELGATDDGVVAEYQTAVLDEPRNGDEFHGGHALALFLVLGHEGAGPGRRVLDEGAGELDACLVGVAQGVGGSGVGDSAGGIGFGRSALCKGGTAAVAGHFHVASFVAGGWITVINPEERADGHLVAGLDQRGVAIGSELHYFARAQVADVFVAQVLEGAALLQGNHGAVFFTQHDGRAAPPIAAGVELALFVHQKDGAAALDLFMDILETIDDGILSSNEGGHHFGGPNHSTGGGILELHAVVLEKLALDFFDIRNQAYCHDGERTELGGHDQRLRVCIRNNANAHVAREGGQVVLELAAEGSVLDVVDGAVESSVGFQHRHAAAMRSEM